MNHCWARLDCFEQQCLANGAHDVSTRGLPRAARRSIRELFLPVSLRVGVGEPRSGARNDEKAELDYEHREEARLNPSECHTPNFVPKGEAAQLQGRSA